MVLGLCLKVYNKVEGGGGGGGGGKQAKKKSLFNVGSRPLSKHNALLPYFPHMDKVERFKISQS